MQRRRYRQYGLSNANQVLLAVVVATLLFLALLRRHWLWIGPNADAQDESAAEVYTGLWGIYVSAGNDTQSVSWSTFCSSNHTLPMPPGELQPLTDAESHLLCVKLATGALLSTVVRAAVATGIGLSMLSVLAAIYLHFGRPSREQVFWVGMVPGIALFIAAVLTTAALVLWQHYYRPFNNGDCFGIVVAATVIAYGVSISMVIRWRWPGVCAVANEQQALTSRGNDEALFVLRRRGRRRRESRERQDAAPSNTRAFHELV